ncbi:four-domain proteases inhibitor-like isoform X2 [Dendronephthya gigantea]|uniref:four-domain proteases inhibitor-like isoform X2 n=1 Tax=Dendronephthya gigantea TaxID=151771 RepID=UPI00106D5797|nr:four-domain proteases inhibitor-like isoform X2 [Dendronephthya gigantea]
MNVCLILVLLVHSLYATSSARSLEPSVCKLQKMTGPCRARIQMYYYDQHAGKCLSFFYGGCRGNKNRFQTLEDCKKQCERSCDRPCPFIYMPVCGTDGETYPNECVLDIAACKSNGKTKRDHDGECEPKCPKVCTMEYNPQCGSDDKTYSNPCELKIASCESSNKITLAHEGKCEKDCIRPCPMIYQPTCGSDGKTYSSVCDLQVASCIARKTIKKVHDGECDVCSMEKIVGPCRAAFPRYYYNSVSKKCESFIYGGCHGNRNNFVKIEDCQKKCDVCSLKQDPGFCRGYFPRYFYNSKSRACEKFIYGGCQGNGNNFETLEACQDKCH